ncbi:MAG: hypothetical protein WD845_16995 [Pirellulales bacterium]
MRFAIAALACMACCSTVARASDDSAGPAKESVRFDGHLLDLASQDETPGQSLKEYIPAGETLEHWTKLAAIREYDALDDPKPVVGEFLQQLKKQYPESPCSVIENPTTGEVIIDFVVWPADASFVEFNVFKYQKRTGGGLIAEQYALREYQDAEGFLKGLRPVRERLVELMTEGLQRDGDPVEVKTNAE